MYCGAFLAKELVAASTEPLILSLLSQGESYGYALIQEVKRLSGEKIEWTDGMLYPVLHRMERRGLDRLALGQIGDRAQAQILFDQAGGQESLKGSARAVDCCVRSV